MVQWNGTIIELYHIVPCLVLYVRREWREKANESEDSL